MSITTKIVALIAIGITSHWLAWWIRIPSIIVLLVLGFIAGPLTGFLNPDALMGDLLQPFVSLSVALILFEGGLSLKYSDIRSERPVLIRLLTAGVFFTWISIALFAGFFTRMDWQIALLVGAILTVTGPTVITPLLRHIRLSGKTSALLKWEGITIDPIGATLAVLVFEAIRAGGAGFSYSGIAIDLVITIVAGGVLGTSAALLIVFLMKRYWIPDSLQGVFALMCGLGVFVISNQFEAEAGLIGVTVMGICLANQKSVSMVHILEFIENLNLILISSLFVILAARLRIDDLRTLNAGILLFGASVIFFARPASVFLSTLNSGLNKKEKIFLAFTAPRGIVAASIASVFATDLATLSYNGIDRILPVIFFIIMSTVLFYGFFSPFLAKRLGLVNPDPQGVLFVGAGPFAREVAVALNKEGIPTLLVDTNMANVTAAKMAGLIANVGSILSDHFIESLELGDMKRLICLTSNDEMNALACKKHREFFGSRETYQLPYTEGTRFQVVPPEHGGRILFRKDITANRIVFLCHDDPHVKITGLSSDFDYEAFVSLNQKETIPLFLIRKNGNMNVFTVDEMLKPIPGDKIVSLCLSSLSILSKN